MLTEQNANIIPIGFIKDREALARYYSAADVFVNVTHVDTLPTVNMESICSGTPVITYDSCGSPELILDGCGRVVKENDIPALIALIKERLAKIDGDALSAARGAYDKNECYQNYLQVYAGLMN